MAEILLAEDDESLRKFLAQALVKAGHTVTDFGDGSDAFACLSVCASASARPLSPLPTRALSRRCASAPPSLDLATVEIAR